MVDMQAIDLQNLNKQLKVAQEAFHTEKTEKEEVQKSLNEQIKKSKENEETNTNLGISNQDLQKEIEKLAKIEQTQTKNLEKAKLEVKKSVQKKEIRRVNWFHTE
eukprot:UN26963